MPYVGLVLQVLLVLDCHEDYLAEWEQRITIDKQSITFGCCCLSGTSFQSCLAVELDYPYPWQSRA